MLGSSFRGHVLTTADVLEDYILLLRDADSACNLPTNRCLICNSW